MKNIIVRDVRDLGIRFQNNPNRVVGMDGAYSIQIGNKILWFFGDTLIGERTEGESLWYPGGEKIGHQNMAGTGKIEEMLTNTALLVSLGTGMNPLQDFNFIERDALRLKQLIPYLAEEDPDQYRIWCSHGIQLEEKIYLYYQKVEMLAEGDVLPVNFRMIGSGLATGNGTNWDFKRIMFNDQTLFWNEQQPQFATSVLNDIDNNGFVYCYGVLKNPEGIQQCYIARVKPEKIASRSSYEYLVTENNSWEHNIKNAQVIFEGMPNELSVSFNKHLNSYLAVHSLDLTGKIVARTAPKPWGPWSDYTELYQVNVERTIDLPYPVLIYAGKEHPELSEDNGRILYITYIEFEEYFPHLIKIELA
ncbi:MAG: DUF4185 domain-containing protein [Bacteroidetes bacterium]|nr:DUF4185 domain-containing protein [Bacteroidota bacterium]